MTKTTTVALTDLATPRRLALLAVPAAAALLLAACGGGGGDTSAPPVTATSTTWADGPIRGFGSVIVNGIRFDDTTATVTDDEGRHLEAGELELGMEVEVEAGDDRGGRATAQGFHVHSAVVGPVEAVDAAAGTVTVLGQSVLVDAATVMDDSLPSGLAGLVPGQLVRVYGPSDAASIVHATRLEAAGAVSAFRVVGAVAAWDPTGQRLVVGSATIDTAGVARLPTGLAAGQRVRVTLATTPTDGVWRATEVRADDHHFGGDHDEAELHGTVTAFTSPTAFSVDGTPVDARAATFPDGTAGLVPGAVVEVEGTLVDGVLVARSVTIEDEHEHEGGEVELHGAVSAVDVARQTFTLRGSVVSWASPDVVFVGGTAAGLVDGAKVEVKGSLGPDGRTVVAATIDFNDD